MSIKNQKEKQSNFECIKILAMLMIVAHHFVAKNAFNVDADIVGFTFNKLFLQFIGNHAFIGKFIFYVFSMVPCEQRSGFRFVSSISASPYLDDGKANVVIRHRSVDFV